MLCTAWSFVPAEIVPHLYDNFHVLTFQVDNQGIILNRI